MGLASDLCEWVPQVCGAISDCYPGYYVVPVRVNGSAVETLFSQFKAASGNKLSSVNYRSSRKAVVAKKDAHPCNVGFRDLMIYFLVSNFSVMHRWTCLLFLIFWS